MPYFNVVLCLLLAGCPMGTTDAGLTTTQPSVVNDPSELITDVQHLLGEAAALHAAERYVVAQQTWQRAYNLFTVHLVVPLRAADATKTLAMEYRFGQLKSALGRRRTRPKPLARALEQELEEHRQMLVNALTQPVPEPTPPTD